MAKFVKVLVAVMLALLVSGCSISPTASASSSPSSSNQALVAEYQEALLLPVSDGFKTFLRATYDKDSDLLQVASSGDQSTIIKYETSLSSLVQSMPSVTDTPASCVDFYAALGQWGASACLNAVCYTQAAASASSGDKTGFNSHVAEAQDAAEERRSYENDFFKAYRDIRSKYRDTGGSEDATDPQKHADFSGSCRDVYESVLNTGSDAGCLVIVEGVVCESPKNNPSLIVLSDNPGSHGMIYVASGDEELAKSLSVGDPVRLSGFVTTKPDGSGVMFMSLLDVEK